MFLICFRTGTFQLNSFKIYDGANNAYAKHKKKNKDKEKDKDSLQIWVFLFYVSQNQKIELCVFYPVWVKFVMGVTKSNAG